MVSDTFRSPFRSPDTIPEPGCGQCFVGSIHVYLDGPSVLYEERFRRTGRDRDVLKPDFREGRGRGGSVKYRGFSGINGQIALKVDFDTCGPFKNYGWQLSQVSDDLFEFFDLDTTGNRHLPFGEDFHVRGFPARLRTNYTMRAEQGIAPDSRNSLNKSSAIYMRVFQFSKSY